jgi:tRNA-dihydrouridine synthase 3
MDFRTRLAGAVIMAPMTKGGNLPYRRLCTELGARITMGEMALARKLRRESRPEFALLRRSPAESFFGVQLAGRDPEELAWAAALAVERGADFVDLNCGCPIDEMVRRGIGAALLQKPGRIAALVAAMKRAIDPVPVTVKIRLGFSEEDQNFLEVGKAAEDAGASAVTLHGRTREARYRRSADWGKVGELVAALRIPVIGNGDLLFPHEIAEARRHSGCAAVMIARGALIKPWIFREASTGVYEDLDPAARMEIYARYVTLAREHFGDGERGRARVREFLRWHAGFWCRYVPRLPDGRFPRLQEREEGFLPRSEAEAALARQDEEGLDRLVDRLLLAPAAPVG